MKAITAMNKRGGKEVAQESSHSTGLSSVGSAYRARSNSASGYSQNTAGGGNSTSIKSAFYDNKGRGEFATEVDKGDGYSK